MRRGYAHDGSVHIVIYHFRHPHSDLRADTVLVGEIGLSGEIRMVGQMPARLREAAKIGFKLAIVPCRLRRTESWPNDIQVFEARSLRQALDQAMSVTHESK